MYTRRVRAPAPAGLLPDQQNRLWLAALTLAAFALRLPLVGRFPFREDEAIYAFWALHGWYADPLFLHVWIDKPPLFVWLLQGAFALWGHGPAAAQVANVLVSTLTVPVLAVTAWRWWGSAAGLAAGLLAALNPLAISFGPTGFTDPLLVLAGSLAVALGARRRWLASGLWLGVAIMTKQQGLLFVPLVAGMMVVEWVGNRPARAREDKTAGKQPIRRDDTGAKVSTAGYKPALRAVVGFVGGVVLVVGPVLVWDSLRWAVAPSPWDLGARNAGFSALVPMNDWAARTMGWRGLLVYLMGSPAAWIAYGALLAAGAGLAWQGRARRARQAGWYAALVAAWAAGLMALHVVTGVQVWDRYLLPLVTAVALLGGWAWGQVWNAIGPQACTRGSDAGQSSAIGAPEKTAGCKPALRWVVIVLATAGVLGASVGAVEAAAGRLPVGGDHGAYAGLDAALAAVNMPEALLYHRELGWHARYYLYDAVRDGAVALLYYPSTTYLADSAVKHPNRRRFVVQADWAPLEDLTMQLAVRGLAAAERLRAGHFVVYEVVEKPVGDAAWRVCAAPGSWRLAGEAGAWCTEGMER